MTDTSDLIKIAIFRKNDDWKPQFGGQEESNYDYLVSLNSVKIKAVNLVIEVNGTELVRRRWEWDSETKLDEGSYSANLKVSENGIEFN